MIFLDIFIILIYFLFSGIIYTRIYIIFIECFIHLNCLILGLLTLICEMTDFTNILIYVMTICFFHLAVLLYLYFYYIFHKYSYFFKHLHKIDNNVILHWNCSFIFKYTCFSVFDLSAFVFMLNLSTYLSFFIYFI